MAKTCKKFVIKVNRAPGQKCLGIFKILNLPVHSVPKTALRSELVLEMWFEIKNSNEKRILSLFEAFFDNP